MPAQYTGGKVYPELEDELQPAHTHIVTKSLSERVEDLEEAIEEIREQLP